MRQYLSRSALVVAWLASGCAVAMEERPVGIQDDDELGGALSLSGTGGSSSALAGSSSAKGGTPGTGFGGTAPSAGGKGGSGSGSGGKAAGGGGGSSSGGGGATSGGTSSGGASSGGKASGGSPSGGSSSGGTAAAGTSSGGSSSAGSPSSTVCDSTPDWTMKTYVIGDTVASTCAAPFDHGCPIGQSHKFECNPMPSGAIGLPWCMLRQPGVGNGWWEAWLDKGQCQ